MKMVGFLKQNLKAQKNMNFENPRALRKNWFHKMKICRQGHLPRPNLNYTVGLARLTASLLTNLRSVDSLKNLLHSAQEGVGDLPNLPFPEEWVKRINIPK